MIDLGLPTFPPSLSSLYKVVDWLLLGQRTDLGWSACNRSICWPIALQYAAKVMGDPIKAKLHQLVWH